MATDKKLAALAILIIMSIVFPIAVLAEEADSFAVVFDSTGGSEVHKIRVGNGLTMPKPKEPVKKGFLFCGWYTEKECLNEWDFESGIVSADITLHAKWAELFMVSAASADESLGEVSGAGEYLPGSSVTLTATPKPGCRFVRWIESDTVNAVYPITVSASMSATAEFLRIDTPSLIAASSGYDSVNLNWNAVAGAEWYELYRYSQTQNKYILLRVVKADVLSYTDKGLITGRPYLYKIRALTSCDTAATCGELSAPAAAVPEIPAPASSKPCAAGYCSIKINWDEVNGATGYEIWRSDRPRGEFSIVGAFDSSCNVRFTDYGLEPDKTYWYKLRSTRMDCEDTFYSEFSPAVSTKPLFTAPELTAVSASDTSIRLSWNALCGVDGYEIYRSDTQYGMYEKIYTASSAPTEHYTSKNLKRGKPYFYKIRAYVKSGKEKVYSPYSPSISAVPSAKLKERSFTVLYQGDSRWGFSEETRKTACLLCAYAITIRNMGIDATPKTVYRSNGRRTNMNMGKLEANFGVRPVCALDPCSPYLRSFNGTATYIKSPSKNAVAAIKEALNSNPEGVIVYFRRGEEAHAIVACKYDGDTIYYSDPGRRRGCLLTFSETWVRRGHSMGYGSLAYIVALDKSE